MMKLSKQFSLRSLIMIVSAFAVLFANEARLEAHRHQLVEAIIHAGGSVSFTHASWPTPFQTRGITSVTIPYMSMDRFSDEQLESLANLREIIIPDVQCPCPGEVRRRNMSCLVPRVDKIPFSVSPDAIELLMKIRGREERLSFREIKAAEPQKR